MKLAILQPAWITASADGKPLPQAGKTFDRNESLEFGFDKIAYVHLGNTLGIALTVDGRPVKLPESRTVTGVLELTPAGERLLPWSAEDPPQSR